MGSPLRVFQIGAHKDVSYHFRASHRLATLDAAFDIPRHHDYLLFARMWSRYITRTIPAQSLGAIAVLIMLSFAVAPYGRIQRSGNTSDMTLWQWIFAAYMTALHILSALFTARAFRAIGYVHKRICETSTFYGTPHKVATSLEFAIIIPAYKEESETLHLTLAVLASHELATSYHVS